MSKDSLMRNFGAGSSSHFFDGALPIRFRTNCCEHGVNEVKEQSVDMKTGGAEPAVSDQMVSTFCSRKLRKSEAENVEQLVVLVRLLGLGPELAQINLQIAFYNTIYM